MDLWFSGFCVRFDVLWMLSMRGGRGVVTSRVGKCWEHLTHLLTFWAQMDMFLMLQLLDKEKVHCRKQLRPSIRKQDWGSHGQVCHYVLPDNSLHNKRCMAEWRCQGLNGRGCGEARRALPAPTILHWTLVSVLFLLPWDPRQTFTHI